MPVDKGRLLGLSLGASGGFADAGSYQLAHCFTGHVTGNTILSALALVGSHWSDLPRPATALALFVLATAAGQHWRKRGESRPHSVAVASLLVGLSALACGRIAGGATDEAWWLVICMPLALGLQNGFFAKVDGVEVHTTYMTGATTKLLKPGAPWSERRVVLEVWLSFLAGAAAVAALLRLTGPRGFWWVELPLAATLLIDLLPAKPDPVEAHP